MNKFNLLDLTGRRYLITGASSGIGRVTSVILSKLGAELMLVDINKEGLNETRCMCPTKVSMLTIDLMETEKIKEHVLQLIPTFGPLHGFAHIAGRSYIAPLKGVNEKTCMDVFKLNAYTAVELAKVFTNRKVYAGDHGSIVFISSVYGIVGSPANIGYAMSKAGIIGATKSLAMELAPKKIRVNCVAPGFVKTEMMDTVSGLFGSGYIATLNDMHPLGLGEASDIAYAVTYLLSDMSKWVTGTVMNVDGGFTAQ